MLETSTNARPNTPAVLHIVQTIGLADGMSIAVMNTVNAFRLAGRPAMILTAMYPGTPLHPALSGDPHATVLRARGPALAKYPFGFSRELTRLCRQIDLVHLHGLWRYPTLIGGPILRRLGVPYVMSPYGTLMPEAYARHGLRKTIAYRVAERRTLKHADFVITTGEGEASALRRLDPELSQRVIPLAIDTEVFRPGEPARRRRGGRRRVLTVSRLHPIKRVVELVEAFGRVARSKPNWDLIIVGPEDDPGYRARVEAMAASTGIAERVRLIGRLGGTELVAQYQDANIFALSSSSEGLGLSIVEALSAGLPVIATTGSPWSELMTSRCGWWVEPDVSALAAALTSAMTQSDDDLDDMGRRARQLAVAKYSLATLRMGLIETYQAALAKSHQLPKQLREAE